MLLLLVAARCSQALFLHKQGIKSIIVEKEAFPRYHIGESLTTRAGNLLRELGFEAEMLDLGTPRKSVSKHTVLRARIRSMCL